MCADYLEWGFDASRRSGELLVRKRQTRAKIMKSYNSVHQNANLCESAMKDEWRSINFHLKWCSCNSRSIERARDPLWACALPHRKLLNDSGLQRKHVILLSEMSTVLLFRSKTGIICETKEVSNYSSLATQNEQRVTWKVWCNHFEHLFIALQSAYFR